MVILSVLNNYHYLLLVIIIMKYGIFIFTKMLMFSFFFSFYQLLKKYGYRYNYFQM